ncbi:hypothetical protein Patl1_21700 [Pistacia atlantica]|uniref:Uncharacterized protein n=1 Tax=Pistacia atlantica TaxID=434234 RepID=A0ACC1BN91_9ROSI|nr:hypothetical protein Patl1_21700 [Pistacia atlantica]
MADCLIRNSIYDFEPVAFTLVLSILPIGPLLVSNRQVNRPFFWVVRPDITNGANEAFPEGFQDRVANRGQMVGWAPQQKCWPYFADDESYICDIWKVGLKFNRDESGIITREEIKTKIDQVVGDENLKARALELEEIALKKKVVSRTRVSRS